MLRDSDGRFFELRLPLDMPSYRTPRHKLPSSFYDLGRMQADIDALLERAKLEIQEIPPEDPLDEIARIRNPVA
jgi:hypothetical protein